MKTQVQISISGSKEKIWNVISDIEDSVNTIESIQEVNILEKPESGLVGLKWTEKRVLFGKEATETMWISEALPNEFYLTQAESHGSVYTTRVFISTNANENILAMEFAAHPQSFGAKIMWGLMGFIFKNATKKALQKDLEDIKKVVEGNRN